MYKFFVIFVLGIACPGLGSNVDTDFKLPNDITNPIEAIVEGIQDVGLTDIDARNPDLLSFYLYRHANPNTPATVLASEDSISAANFNSSLLTVIFIHGHGETGFSASNQYIRNALFSVDDVNLIVLDWSIYSTLTYTQAASAVPQVAAGLATFIELLTARNDENDNSTAINPDPSEVTEGTETVATLANMHIIGFNLGAHIAGIAGRRLPGLARVTGLDPAASEWGAASVRLRLTDARFVEVIHTDGGTFGNGLGTPIGLVDIFANGGSNQPGCLTHSCSHNRAYELFAASIVNPNLVATHCATILAMNLNLCRGTLLRIGQHDQLMKPGGGIYRINTRRNYPF